MKSDYQRGYAAGRNEVARDAIEIAQKLHAQIAELTRDRDEWKQQHENLLEVRQQDLAAIQCRHAAPTDAGSEAENFKGLIDAAIKHSFEHNEDAAFKARTRLEAAINVLKSSPQAPKTEGSGSEEAP